MAVMAARLAADEVDAWEAWIGELTGPRRAEFDDINTRHGLTAHEAYLQPAPDGSLLVLVVHGGPGGAGFLGNMAASDNSSDRWFVESVAALHGMDMGSPPPAPVRKL
jgi:hypothetical protein